MTTKIKDLVDPCSRKNMKEFNKRWNELLNDIIQESIKEWEEEKKTKKNKRKRKSIKTVIYECGCTAGGDNIALNCPIHLESEKPKKKRKRKCKVCGSKLHEEYFHNERCPNGYR